MDSSLKNLERNFNSAPEPAAVYRFDEFRLQCGPRLLSKNGEELPLTPKAVATLCVLAEKSGQVVSKDELIRRIWPDTVVEESNLSQHLHQLRKALGDMPDGRPYIETLKRRGYRFNAPVTSSANGAATLPAVDTAIQPVQDYRQTPQGPSRHGLFPVVLAGAVVLVAFLVIGFVVNRGGGSTAAGGSKISADVIITPLTSGENVTQTAVSHDGNHFVYSDFDGDRSRLVLGSTDRTSRSELLPFVAGRIENLSFSPDDLRIYFVINGAGQSNGLYRTAPGAAPTKVFDTVTSPVSFSDDGKEMIFVRPGSAGTGEIVRSSSDGSSEQVLLAARDEERISADAVLSHSGNFVIFGSIARPFPSVCTLTKLDLPSGTVTPLTSEGWDSCYRIAITKDDSGIAFVGTRHKDAFSPRRDQVYYLQLGSSESRRLTSDGNWHDPMSLSMTDAGDILALPLNRISQLWKTDLNGNSGTAEQITQGQSDGRNGIVPTRDGKIIYLSRDGDGSAIYESNADGQDRRRVYGSPTLQELRAPPDTRFLVFAEQQDDFTQLFRTDRNGGDRRQLTFGRSSKIDSTVSPDGAWIAYADTAVVDGTKIVFTLQRIPAGGGEPEIIADRECEVPHYSNDGRFITCSSDAKISILSADTGNVVREFAPQGDFLSNSGVRWSPDDRYLVYRVIRKGATNLWRQPVNGGDPEPMTNFPKGELYNFVFAPDGTVLYLSRGTQIRNAVLIKDYR